MWMFINWKKNYLNTEVKQATKLQKKNAVVLITFIENITLYLI